MPSVLDANRSIPRQRDRYASPITTMIKVLSASIFLHPPTDSPLTPSHLLASQPAKPQPPLSIARSCFFLLPHTGYRPRSSPPPSTAVDQSPLVPLFPDHAGTPGHTRPPTRSPSFPRKPKPKATVQYTSFRTPTPRKTRSVRTVVHEG